jgi:hypothetical protein
MHDMSEKQSPPKPSLDFPFTQTPAAQAGTRRGQSTSGDASALQLQAVTSHTAAYLERWRGAQMQDFALTLISAGRGPARLPTCEHTLRHARIKANVGDTFQRVEGASAVVVRALSFFGPGELRALRVEDHDVFRLIMTILQPRCDGGDASASRGLGCRSCTRCTAWT